MSHKPKLTPTFADNPVLTAAPPDFQPVTVAQKMFAVAEGAPSTPLELVPAPAEPVQTVPEPPPLKVALIGTAPSSRLLAPYNDPSWEIWACSPGNMNSLPRVTKWFELHANLLWPEYISYGAPYIEWLKQQKFPVYMQSQEWVPNAITFPKDKMVEIFGKDFFTSSFAWMMALAITEGAKEIALFGIDMASKEEYILQRPGFYYFKYRAEQLGIRVWAPYESDILQHAPLYGYSDVTPMGRKMLARDQELAARIEPMKAEVSRLQHSIAYLEGAREDLDYVKSIWLGAQS